MKQPPSNSARKAPHLRVVSGARLAAAEALSRVLDDHAGSSQALHAVLAEHVLPDRDRALATELFFGALRLASPLEKSLLRSADKPGRGLDERIRPHLLIAAYQLQYLSERIPAHAAVNEAIDAVRRARPGLEGFANALLRRLGSPLSALLTPQASVDDIADAWGVPRRVARAVAQRVPSGQRAEAIAALSSRPTSWIAWLSAPPSPSSTPHAFIDRLGTAIGGRDDSDGDGDDGSVDFVAIEGASALAVELLALQPAARVMLCGTPTPELALLLASAVGENGRVVVVDKNDKRRKRAATRCRQASWGNRVELHADDTTLDDAPAGAGGETAGTAGARAMFDAILVDVPCTSLGAMRKKPEVKLALHDDATIDAALASTAPRQRALLDACVARLRVGGAIVVSVASPLPEEGAQLVAALLASHGDLTRDDVSRVVPRLPADARTDDGDVQLLPHAHGCDATFLARVVRRS